MSSFEKLKFVRTKKEVKWNRTSNMTEQALIGEHLGVSEQEVIQKQPRILHLKVSILKQRELSDLLNRIMKRDFYILGPTQGSEGKGAIRQLKLFLSSKRI